MSDYTVYIDEAGDLGIGKGTQWFVLTAVIVKKCDEPTIRKCMDGIKTKLNVHDIHMRKINDFMRRAYIVRELSKQPFTYMNVIVDTSKFDVQRIPSSLIAYNYICKYLLQRVSWWLRDQQATADVVLSARGTSRDGELIDYITQKLLPYKYNSIESNVFERISAKSAATWDMLQLADVCTTSMFLMHEINGWGFTTPCFTLMLRKHLFENKGKVETYGIKYFVDDMRPDGSQMNEHWPCNKK